MKKILGSIFCLLFILSILISVSSDLTTKLKEFSGDNEYASSFVPIPKTNKGNINFASKPDGMEGNSNNSNFYAFARRVPHLPAEKITLLAIT